MSKNPQKINLTDTYIRGITPPPADPLPGNKYPSKTEVFDSVVPGLTVRISHTGRKTFTYRYTTGGSTKRYTIGRFPSVTLAAARRVAKDLAEQVAGGSDPQTEKILQRQEPDTPSVRDLADEFIDRHLPKLKTSTQTDYKQRIHGEILPVIGDVQAHELTRRQIVKLLSDIADGTKDTDPAPIQSNRVRAVLSSMYSFGINRGLVELDFNPVQQVKPLGKENSRQRVYSEDEIRIMWDFFEDRQEPTRSLLKVLLITGQRFGETRQMQWDQIVDGVWTIPKEITKAGRIHDVPLPSMALDVIEQLRPLNGHGRFVFASPFVDDQPISWIQYQARQLREADGGIADFRIHDMRRTAASYMAKLGTDRTVLGKILNHKGLAGDNQVTAVYDRHQYMDEKRRALQKWSSKLHSILHPDEGTAKIYKLNG
jgi:integrase